MLLSTNSLSISRDTALLPDKFARNATRFSPSCKVPRRHDQPRETNPEEYADERIPCHAPLIRTDQTRGAIAGSRAFASGNQPARSTGDRRRGDAGGDHFRGRFFAPG